MPVGGSKGSGGSASDVRAGGGYVEISGRDKLSAVLDNIKKKAAAFASFMQKAGATSLAVGAGLAAPLAALFKGGLDRAAKTGELAEQFGATAEEISKLMTAFEQGGVSAEDFGEALKGLSKKNLQGAPLVPLILDVVDSLNQMPDASERAAKSMEVFEEAGVKILRGGRGLRERFNAASPITGQQVTQARAVQAAWTTALISIQQAMLPLLQFITPLVKSFAQFAQQNAFLLTTLAGVALGFVALGGAMLLAGTTISGILTVLGILKAGFLLLLTPVGLASLAVVGLGALILTQTKEGRAAVDSLGDTFASLGEIFGRTWKGIANAVRAGDLELAFKIAANGISTIWSKLMLDLARDWEGFIGPIAAKAAENPELHSAIVNSALTALGPWGQLLNIADAVRGGDIVPKLGGLAPDTAGLAAKLARNREEGLQLRAKAATEAAASDRPDLDYMKGAGALGKNFKEVKGAFDTFSTSAQRFGYGSKRDKEVDILQQIAAGKGELPNKIGAAVAVALRVH